MLFFSIAYRMFYNETRNIRNQLEFSAYTDLLEYSSCAVHIGLEGRVVLPLGCGLK